MEYGLIKCYTNSQMGDRWLQKYKGLRPSIACVLGFTATGLIPNISAAGATPSDRQYTALADAEFLWHGGEYICSYPLPPLTAGVSPVVIGRAVIENLQLPLQIFNAGLPKAPNVPCIDLGGIPANSIETGKALPIQVVRYLFNQGLTWGQKFAEEENSYIVIGECVVGGTTTALGIFTGLGINATGKINSSHAQCNHAQKAELVKLGLAKFDDLNLINLGNQNPLDLIAAVGDPMQPVVAGMAITASHKIGVLLAGGTQMLAVYALIKAIAEFEHLTWQPENIAVGTTKWVAEDLTGDTVGLAQAISPEPILLATKLSFTQSKYSQLRRYEEGFVKEGVGAGGCAIAASLYRNWDQNQLLSTIEEILKQMGLQP
ncbi:TIGR00303 family protein [Synechococcus sp. PCC 7502]|uniref:nicotinate mononucleotide-dependent phosphoribosyltransferase CobT n=1 Tax=Synechococcus sp. PCC 7502 TaxID=1173263 RepID=UPI00029FC9DA|nr:TIGR00303 family protein [Synechococcus sp. PCC 7502]AFY74836.1 TIGR00303 family protein [Synechococcus sp. PCC 7502]